MKRFPLVRLPGNLTVDTWFDRQSRSWVTQLKDGDGLQVGDAEYDGNVDSVEVSRNGKITDGLGINAKQNHELD